MASIHVYARMHVFTFPCICLLPEAYVYVPKHVCTLSCMCLRSHASVYVPLHVFTFPCLCFLPTMHKRRNVVAINFCRSFAILEQAIYLAVLCVSSINDDCTHCDPSSG